MDFKTFGKKPSGARKMRIESAFNYSEGEFRNVEPTSVNPNNVPMLKILKEFMNKPASVKPPQELPNIKTNLSAITSNTPAVVWFGHSSYFINSNGYTILVDPVFSGNASPVSFFGRSFPGADKYEIEDFPEIDLLILTHDHYDHLDLPSIQKLRAKTKKIVTSLGVGAHLEYWGVAASKITELNWWEREELNASTQITATPSRHFSGRGIKRAQTLWSSFVLEIGNHKIFIGADSGYDAQFKKIGKEFGAFDLAFLECGQYGVHWPQIHMFPEQTVQAAKDLNTKMLFPVHWGKFVLSNHPWNESIKRLVTAAEILQQDYVSPQIGEVFYLGQTHEQKFWWELE
ncbi:MBL fold metallo-hydrolase [Gillisia sp. M10.2A]|uniref:MBL fold metallo-hydrolase n=1 Tax=Gillisia lutea TaxID=2909668 RepID=A0ABS9EEZ6_9FLAO|nr:MBL fold metallo-hydrolase [Gillisia lutea]MCF4101432.1 MBL fold metallo-hydrolase [Gillisia lutea]